MALPCKPLKLDPELQALLEQVKDLPPMTPAQRRLQRISFAYGNLPEGNNLSRDEVARIHDEHYGVPCDCGKQIPALPSNAEEW